MHFFIFTTKTIKVIFWKKLVVMPLFSQWMGGNGRWDCSWRRISTCHPFCSSRRWQGLVSLLAMLELPLGDLCGRLSSGKASYTLWASEAWSPFRKRGAPWTLLDWKNQLTLSLPGAYKWFPFLVYCSLGSICSVLGCSQSHHVVKSENYPLSSTLLFAAAG